MSFAFELMLDAGLAKPKARPEGEWNVTQSRGLLITVVVPVESKLPRVR